MFPFSTPGDILAAVALALIIWAIARRWLPRPGNDPSDEEMGYDPAARPPTDTELDEPDSGSDRAIQQPR